MELRMVRPFVRNWYIQYIKKEAKILRVQQEVKLMMEHIDRRAAMIQDNQTRMLSSLLNRYKEKLVIDRIVLTDNDSTRLITDPEELLCTCHLQYDALKKKRIHGFDNLDPEWQQTYDPILSIPDRAYDALLDEPSLDEWNDVVRSMNQDSAPGSSTIGYRMLQKLGTSATTELCKFGKFLFTTGAIPVAWKQSQIYLIPKPKEWQYNLNNTRPIILLECTRKVVVKILTKRLSKICVSNDILQGPNFAGLPGNSTNDPSHIINNFMEDARDNRKERWILFQDRARAFDSVGMVPLEKALRRIRCPERFITFIINLFSKRSLSIITHYSPTPPFEAGDGIDQGEVMSPLLWRIFYDPLLTRVQHQSDLGYKMNEQLQNIQEVAPSHAVTDVRISGLAYADDTAWIARNKQDLLAILDIAHSFFRLNDIQINGSKSELIVINGPKDPAERKVKVGIDDYEAEVTAVHRTKPVRYLGVYLKEQGNHKHVIDLIRDEVKETTTILSQKRITLAHVVYVNNKVLIPRIEYRAKLTFVEDILAKKLFAPVQKLYKHTLGCASMAPNHIMTHQNIGGLKSIEKIMKEAHFTEFVIQLNDNTWMGQTTRIRLFQAQRQLGLNSPIFLVSATELVDWPLLGNLNYDVLLAMKTQLYSFNCTRVVEAWNELHSSIALNEIFNANLNHYDHMESRQIRRSFIQRSRGQQFLTSLVQFLKLDNQFLRWGCVKSLYGLSAQGSIPRWIKFLERMAIGAATDNGIRNLIMPYNQTVGDAYKMALRPTAISIDKRVKEWVASIRADGITVGKIVTKLSLTQCMITHWLLVKGTNDLLVPCKGCSKSDHMDRNGCCILKIGSLNLATITVSKAKGLLMQGTHVEFIVTYPLYNILMPQQCRPTS